MARVAAGSVVQQIGSLFEGGSVAGLSDRQLLERYIAGGRDPSGEAAFAALVVRHGPMVLGVCRQLLGDRQHAEDAFQAAFLVLAQRAGSIRDPDLLGGWLYGVATRTARCARHRIARRGLREEGDAMRGTGAGPCAPAESTAPPADRPAIDREQAEALHGEIDRLPRAFRLPVVLCYFEGLTLDEAARRLRCPDGTLRSRLARAREKLRIRLAQRGIVLPAAALGALLESRPASASVSPLLCDSTTRAALRFAAPQAAGGVVSATAAALAQEVLRTMLIHKLRTTMLSLLLLAAVATGAGLLTRSLAMKEEPVKDPAASKAGIAPRDADRPGPQTKTDPASPGRMTVTGRVLDPDGKPAAGVPVDIIAAPRTPMAGTDMDRDAYVLLGQGSADVDGSFRIEATRASSARFSGVYALAGAARPGSAFGCVRLHPDAEKPAAEIPLQPEQIIRGRLVDVSGQPAAGVEVRLNGVYSDLPRPVGGRFDSPSPGPGYIWSALPETLRAWPKAATTDAQGRFTFAGVGRGLHVSLAVRDPRFAQQRFDLRARGRDPAREVPLALHPAKLIEGRVLAADTGRTIPDAVISVRASAEAFGPMFTTKFRADGQGRFQINPYAGDYFRMRAFAPEGQPYLAREAEFEWTKGAVKKEVDLTLPRGVLIRGKVTEAGSDRPVAGSSVQFFPRNRSGDIVHGFEATVATKDDASFQLAVPPGKGYLMVLGPTSDYIPREISIGELYHGGRPFGKRFYAHDIIAYEVKAGDGPHPLSAKLQPGKTLRGRLVGPAGETVEDAVVLTRQQLDPLNLTWQAHDFLHAHDGRFEMHGFDPEKATPVYFLDAEHQWGAAVELSGKQAGEDLTIRLQPCGQAKARFVGPDGKPVAKLNIWPYLQILMTPGSIQKTFSAARGEPLEADAAFLPNVDRNHYPTDLATDADGRITLPALIPGAPYRISDWSTINVQDKGVQLRKDFTVKPGETLDLGEILVEKPQAQ